MNFRAIVLLVILALLALFGLQNWNQISAVPAEGAGAEFLWMDIPATASLVLFGTAFGLTALYTLLAAQLRTSGLLEARRYSKEVDQARRLADEAEASRFEQLRGELEADRGAFDLLLKTEGELTRAKIDALTEMLTVNGGTAAPSASREVEPVDGDDSDFTAQGQ